MKRLIIATALALCAPAFTACDLGAVSSANVAAEKATTAANEFYTSASKAGKALVLAGLLDKAKYQAADANAYSILLQLRAGQATFAQLVDATKIMTGAK